MNCPDCQNVVPDTVLFCAYCGARVVTSQLPPAGQNFFASAGLRRRPWQVVILMGAVVFVMAVIALGFLSDAGNAGSPAAVPTATPQPTPVTSLTSDPDSVIFGPESGTIEHVPEDEFVEEFGWTRTGEDVVAEATFYNPYSSSSEYWEHGFLLRGGGGSYHHSVSIDSDGNWKHLYRSERAVGSKYEKSPAINTSPSGKNTLAVVTIGPDAWLYINGKYQGHLDFSAIAKGSDVRAFVRDDSEGETRFEDFTIWKWGPSLAAQLPEVWVSPTPTPAPVPPLITPTPTPVPPLISAPGLVIFGPESGTIAHEPRNWTSFKMFDKVPTSENVVVEATFYNPYSSSSEYWERGFLLRDGGVNYDHRVSIDSNGNWRHLFRSKRGVGSKHEKSPAINTSPRGKNTLAVVMIGPDAWLYINGKYQAKLDFSAITDGNDVRAFFRSDSERETRFENFTIWKWRPGLYDLPD